MSSSKPKFNVPTVHTTLHLRSPTHFGWRRRHLQGVSYFRRVNWL